MVFDANKNIRAVKVVDLEGAGPEVVEGFRNEISLLQRLQYCKSVIKMYNLYVFFFCLTKHIYLTGFCIILSVLCLFWFMHFLITFRLAESIVKREIRKDIKLILIHCRPVFLCILEIRSPYSNTILLHFTTHLIYNLPKYICVAQILLKSLSLAVWMCSELNEVQNCLYVVLEFGETDLAGFFSSRAKQQQGLDPEAIKFYWGEMLRAVNALHSEGEAWGLLLLAVLLGRDAAGRQCSAQWGWGLGSVTVGSSTGERCCGPSILCTVVRLGVCYCWQFYWGEMLRAVNALHSGEA